HPRRPARRREPPPGQPADRPARDLRALGALGPHRAVEGAAGGQLVHRPALAHAAAAGPRPGHPARAAHRGRGPDPPRPAPGRPARAGRGMTAPAAATRAKRRTTRPRDEFDPTPWPVALLCGAAGGVCALLAFPPYDLWMLLPVAIALLCAGLLVRSAGLALLVSLLWGLALFVPLTHWAGTYAGAMPWVALGAFEALYIVRFGLLARTVMVRRGLCLSCALIVSARWVGVGTLRSPSP